MDDKRLMEYKLYAAANMCVTKDDAIMREAAAELATLRAENDRLREALVFIDSHLCVLAGNVFDAEKRDHKWEGMHKVVESWRSEIKEALK